MKKFIIAFIFTVFVAGFVSAADYDYYVEARVNEPQFIMQVESGSTNTVTFHITDDGSAVVATDYTATMYADSVKSFGSSKVKTVTGTTTNSTATFDMATFAPYQGNNNWFIQISLGTAYKIKGILQIDATPLSSGGRAVVSATMTQAASVTATAATEQTNTFTTAFGAAPVVTATYTEDPGDVRSVFIGAITTTNFICTITADKNFSYVAVGARP